MALVGLCCLLAPAVMAGGEAEESRLFPSWPSLEPRVQFWTDVYTLYTTRQAVLHDEDHPQVIYGVVDLGGPADGGRTEYPEMDELIMEAAVDWVRKTLEKLLVFDGDLLDLTDEELLIHAASASLPDRETAVDRVRSQRGQADRFRLSVERSGKYLDAMRRIAAEVGVPEDLVYLPHVESSFDAVAESHAGATGMWQFMRGTARQYLTMDGFRDERKDPWLSTRAAFRFLRQNYQSLEEWPLAITAYNHGPTGMLRAKRRHGDLEEILAGYEARTFGFASRNFYAEFIAARRVARQPDVWFSAVRMESPLRFDSFKLPEYVVAQALWSHFGIPLESLEMLNPALDSEIWKGKRLMPRGYELRVPPGYGDTLTEQWNSLSADVRFDRNVEEVWHRVRSGDNLSTIARRYKTSVTDILALNRIGSRSLIHPGQRLKISEAEQWVSLGSSPEDTSGSFLRHEVRRGETLSSIAVRYGIAIGTLLRINDIRDASRLLAGQTLLIPHAD